MKMLVYVIGSLYVILAIGAVFGPMIAGTVMLAIPVLIVGYVLWKLEIFSGRIRWK